MSLVREVEMLSHAYARKGGKDNRRQQRARMIAFATHAEAMGARSMAQVGKAHVIGYWKAHRELTPSTAYNHWLALCVLWKLANKAGTPPEPKQSS